MTSEEQPLPRIGRPADGNRDFHAPVTAHVHESGVQVVTFTGAEEGDVLHAATAWTSPSTEPASADRPHGVGPGREP